MHLKRAFETIIVRSRKGFQIDQGEILLQFIDKYFADNLYEKPFDYRTVASLFAPA